jgi:hypothetical protein
MAFCRRLAWKPSSFSILERFAKHRSVFERDRRRFCGRILDRLAPIGFAHRYLKVAFWGSVAVIGGALVAFWLLPV